MVFKAIETTLSRAEEVRTWHINIYWWYLSSRQHQGKLHQKCYGHCQTIKVFRVYRSRRKITIFTNPRAWYFRVQSKLSQHDGFTEKGEKKATCLPRRKIYKFLKIRKLAQKIGKIVAALQGSKFSALYYKGLDKNKQYGLQKSKYKYESYVELF